MRDLSLSTLEIKPVEKNSLFFGKYRYSARFDLEELGIIRKLDVDIIDKLVSERNDWRQQHQRLYNLTKPGTWQITPKATDKLKRMCRLLAQYKDYTNDLELVKLICYTDFVGNFQAQEAVQVCPAGTIALKDPKWTHRTYFKSKTVTDIQRDTLINYLNGRENVRLSPGLKDWTITRASPYWKTWVQDYYFIDHNNDGEVLFLNMVVPRITGRTLNIVAK
jgi:hypothetical protein